MVQPGFSHRRHRELVACRKLDAAGAKASAPKAMQAPVEDVELTDVDDTVLSLQSDDMNAMNDELADAALELHHFLELEMAREPDSWMSVGARLQEKLPQNLMMEVVEGDAKGGEPRGIALLSVLDVLIRSINDRLQVGEDARDGYERRSRGNCPATGKQARQRMHFYGP
ncbi:hypothetical protein DOTSEDRAFT_23354 [Dothistroma septosporum NZE10]|uniref:Uncharacterized protein n=1 Tax=Dothistroma septosporum (strain NZE10 / CBS 128990) TaxID=675120 RepID=N1PQT8_DOTSN|nr:hypothetical protein DOTSEDRAFT_23354 [Dothistroma septosporum NZE10]